MLKEVKPGGGTTLLTGIDQAAGEFKKFMEKYSEAKTFGSENRMVMLTDVEDNSIAQSKEFIRKVEASQIHTTIVGIS